MIIANISVPLLGIVDTAILGHLPEAQYLAAVAVGSSILSFIYWGFGFLRMGTTGLTAQAFGAARQARQKLIIFQSICLAAAIGLLVILLSPALIAIGLRCVEPPAGSLGLAQQYLFIRIFSAPAVMINYAIIGWLIGRQNTRLPLLITVATNLVNIGLDLLLIVGLGMTSDGAALATLVAEYGGCALALVVLLRQTGAMQGDIGRRQLTRLADYQQLLRVNRHLFVRTIALLASFAFFTAQGASQGQVILAANTILLQLLLLVAFGLDGFAHAAEALVGDAIGRQQHALFIDTCRHCGWWSLLTAAGFSLLYLGVGTPIIDLMTSIDSVRTAATEYLPWLIALPLVAMASYLLDGIFIGATKTGAMQSTMLLAVILVYGPAWYFSRDWGNHGLWLAFLLFNGARGLLLGVAFGFYNRSRGWW